MQVSGSTQQYLGMSAYRRQDNISNNRGTAAAAEQQTAAVSISSEAAEVCMGHDFTHMSSSDMLAMANSLHREGNIQDFLTMAVFSAQAALEDHPDGAVGRSWNTPRNADGTFDLLAEIQSRTPKSLGVPEYEKERQDDQQHLLATLLAMPKSVIKIETSLIDIVQ